MNGFIYGLAWTFLILGGTALVLLIGCGVAWLFGTIAMFGNGRLPPPDPRSIVTNSPTRTVTPFKVQ